MNLTDVMISANVRNWLRDLAIGAKAEATPIMCGVGERWLYEASVFSGDMIENRGQIEVSIHNAEAVAKAAELDLITYIYTEDDWEDRWYTVWRGIKYFMFNGVRFYDVINDLTEVEKWERINFVKEKEHENEGEQSSDSGVSEEESVDNE